MPDRIETGSGTGQEGSAGTASVSHRTREAGALLRVDLVTAEVVSLFDAAGIRSILLKGPSFRTWLYPHGGRLYSDTDLLVAPQSAPSARAVLAAAGFAPVERQMSFDEPKHALGWERARDGAAVDLHVTIKGTGVPADEVWRVLSVRTERMDLRGHSVEVLDAPGRLLHVVLHAAQHASIGRTLEDLRRAARDVDRAEWVRALELARKLQALEAFRRGLAASEDGEAVGAGLGLPPWRPSPPTTKEILAARPAVPVAAGIERLTRTRGVAAKVALVVHKLFSREALTRWTPSAARGSGWLWAARIARPIWLVVRLPGALVRLRGASRASRRARGEGAREAAPGE